MNLIEEHKKAREESSITVFHEFKLRYKKNQNVIYGFVEGKEDPCFYRGFIENSIPEGWVTELWSSGNKDKVFEIYSKFDWRRFNKNQILFFVDRDLSDFIKGNMPTAVNIYVTDKYSIENDVANKNTCDRILREICGFSKLTYNDSDKIQALFEEQMKIFQKALIPVMANIILWQKNNLRPCLNDIYMKHIFKIKKGIVGVNEKPKRKENLMVYIHEQCNMPMTDESLATEIIKTFEDKKHYKKFIRGKYIFWFLIEFSLSVHKDYKQMSISFTDKPKMAANLSISNGITQIAPRSKIPESLKVFFEETIDKYKILRRAA